ncbi:type IX secretion system membrane protein, PorP/SprF family [Robiginitalea myxolifaciens]|uniref:Type IX secretion system membrane protein, PorP/SprF family n=1 Tax=Robiginitalea myxolifaciens TaxID=400055 RepID=A0A1I6G382_9FLAO|nr:type IX secretion system membrane protein PorP/SprF [Robiginitalea myxolifaciens]SFR36639.1 type IX secretion system membrane protein, PorP/SprF family [Robiginitalea myxolifaciens]
MNRKLILFILAVFSLLPAMQAQEENPFIAYDVPSQNLLKFNRFLINPTFSTVREDKSYINLLHRNQAVSFDDNRQMYFLSYSGRIGDRAGLGLSLYTQQFGTLSNYGVLANYAYGVKLSDKSNFTFGANLSYYNSGFDESRANPVEVDPFLSGFQDGSFLTFQPGFNLSYGAFDFGMYAENLFDYNLKTSEQITEFSEKTFSGHLQYTHQFDNTSGLFEGGRLMPLARTRKVGDDFVLGGNLILDLPKIGWLQGGYDSFYGASAGIGFNINRRVSIGYTMEKGLSSDLDNFGVTHEVSFAYSFTPNLTEDRVMLEDNYQEELAQNNPESLTQDEKDIEIAELKRRLAENDAILAELMFRQDSLESNRQADLERRFEMVMRMVRQETNGERPDLEARARETYFVNNDKTAVSPTEETIIPSGTEAVAATENQTVEENQVAADPAANDRLAAANPVVREPQQQDVTRTAQQVNPKPVKRREFRDLQDVAQGYYVVANVYKGEAYLNKFVDQMRAQGFEADYIDNPNNGLKYVYLKKLDTWEDAETAVLSSLNGAYDGQLWVMNVTSPYENRDLATTTPQSRRDNINTQDQDDRYDATALRKNVVQQDVLAAQDPSNRQLINNGSGSGFYIIANVFAKPRNATRFVRYLNSLGLSASYFINPENNYRYVYLKRHDSWNNALISYYSKLNNTYDQKMWIMRVTPNLIA